MKPVFPLSLQSKINLVCIAVIVPTLTVSTIVSNRLVKPVLEQEIREKGLSTARALISDITSNKWLNKETGRAEINQQIDEILYLHPTIVRIDVYARNRTTGKVDVVASNYEINPESSASPHPLEESVKTELVTDETGARFWEVFVPIRAKSIYKPSPQLLMGGIRLVISLMPANAILGALWQVNAMSSTVIVLVLIVALSYFLRKALQNDKLLRLATSQNLRLSEQLQQVEQQLTINEKMAAMGQLTAHLAHQIGTPLNSIGGHIQLLREDIADGQDGSEKLNRRVNIIEGELSKIEGTVRDFLNSTTKESPKREPTDLNHLVERTLVLMQPRFDVIDVFVAREFERNMDKIYVVPVDIEHIMMNLLNNSYDSLKVKRGRQYGARLHLRVGTRRVREGQCERIEITVRDSGIGIKKGDLKKVKLPFFTTKGPAAGTGLGLNICERLADKYDGSIEIDSEEGSWTEVKLSLPLPMTA